MKATAIGYMCSIDFDEHLENDFDGVPVYSSLRSIRHHRSCVKGKRGCGIYRVKIEKVGVSKRERL